ncbi:LOW QUALITY PROTEIN: uncharacterized protein LOC131823072, partial [Mustela lutreola]|uniref:LOW QUALITY PROTEIN: uncharacterized protein LOC131823072 n=1 Tax=Mustela lutreola TaxID=9666 RepID=UPI0027971DD3
FSLVCVCVCTVGTRAASGCACPWQRCTWGVGGEFGGTFRLRRFHWSGRWAGGRAGAARALSRRGDESSSRGAEGPARGQRTLRRASRSAGTQGPGRTWCLVRPAAASRRRPGLRRPQALPGRPLPHGSYSSSFHRTLFLLLSESSNFEKMSFCQIRRDSLWSFLRSVRTQSAPRGRAQPVAGPSGHTRLWLELGPPTPRESRRSRDPAPRMPETLQGPRRPLAPSQDALAASAPPAPRMELLGAGALCAQPLFPQTATQGSPDPPPPTFAVKETRGKGLGWGPEVGSPLPRVLSSDAGSASLPFPVASSVRQTLSTPGGALPPRLPQTSASLVKSPELAGKARELCRGNRHDSSPSALILS